MGNGGIQLRVSDLLFAVQKRWKLIIALTVIGGAIGLMLAGMTYVQSSLTSYQVSGTVVITTLNAKDHYLYGENEPSQNDFNLAMDMSEPVLYILRSDRVIEDVINKQELLGITVRDIRNNLTLNVYNATMIVEMSLNWTNDEEGIKLWHSLIDSANEILPSTLQMGRLVILDDCVATAVGVGGAGKSMPVLLMLLGLLAGIGFAVMEILIRPTLTNVKDVETTLGLETIGLIPRDDKHFSKRQSILIQDDIGSSEVVQNYSAAAYILRNRLGTMEKPQIFYVTSATRKEGRTTVAANMAIQLSDMEHRTLLVDFDIKNPTLGALFMNSVDYEHSLNALYRGDINEKEAVTTLTGYLDILPMVLEHNAISMDGMIIELIKKISANYEYVILDAPPVGIESETLSLNQIATTVLFVVGYDNASIPEIQSALEKLDKSGIRVLGCMVNNVQGTRYRGEEEKEKRRQNRSSAKRSGKEPEAAKPQGTETDAMESMLQKEKKDRQKSEKNSGRKKGPAEPSGPALTTDSGKEKKDAPFKPQVKRDLMEELTKEEGPRESTPTDAEILERLEGLSLEHGHGEKKETEQKDASASDSAEK